MISTIIYPCAGNGTRLAPITKHMPKEMLPIIDVAAIHYSIAEGMDVGATTFIIIVNDNKISLVRYLKTHYPHLQFEFIYQDTPKGLGDAIALTKDFIQKDSQFGVILPDDIFDASVPPLQQLMINKNVVGVQSVPRNQMSNYGIIEANNGKFVNIIEKPSESQVSEIVDGYAAVGRYIFDYAIFDSLEKTLPGKNNEIQLSDAINLFSHDNDIFIKNIDGTRYDCGSKIGYVKAVINFALKNGEYKDELKDFLSAKSIDFV